MQIHPIPSTSGQFQTFPYKSKSMQIHPIPSISEQFQTIPDKSKLFKSMLFEQFNAQSQLTRSLLMPELATVLSLNEISVLSMQADVHVFQKHD